MTKRFRFVRNAQWLALTLLFVAGCPPPPSPIRTILTPSLGTTTWQISGEPDLGVLTNPNQQPVDFAIWQAADSSWQLWSCIRSTKEPGNNRLFYCWEGAHITDSNWVPKKIAMQSDTSVGEIAGGLQAPFVIQSLATDGVTKLWRMFYGTWENIAEQTSTDGKVFQRVIRSNGKVGIFSEGDQKRDPMLLYANGVDYLYYSSDPNGINEDDVSTSTDGAMFSTPKNAASGGQAGTGFSSAECPFVVYRDDVKLYYLFRTQVYGANAKTSVYASTDPTNFGVNDDSHFITTLPVAAPEIHTVNGVDYIAYLLPNLKGIQLSTLNWTVKP